MAALQAWSLLHAPPPSSSRGRFRASLHVPANLRNPSGLPPRKMPTSLNLEELMMRGEERTPTTTTTPEKHVEESGLEEGNVVSKLYAIMEAAADRAQMHDIIGAQRNNWNHLLLNSLNAITLTASISAGLSAISLGEVNPHDVAFKVSSAVLYSAATVMLLVVNKIQPSQLAEEQRNGARLFRQLEKRIQTTLALRTPTPMDVEDAMDRVLALDKAYPLSLLPGMLEKFPKTVEATVWWPKLGRLRQQRQPQQISTTNKGTEGNGWNKGLEDVMTGVLRTLKKKDTDEYLKQGRLVLSINRVLAVAGPATTGLAAVGAGLLDTTSLGAWPLQFAVVGGALATVLNSLEHGGQIGMIFELFRNCAGFYRHLEEEIEFNLEEAEVHKRENGELFELRMALQLGRSLSEIRSLSSSSRGQNEDGEHAGKLF